jgi:hypothetical protein
METISLIEIGLFCSSVVLAIITVIATLINYYFFRSQVDPNVIIYATLDFKRPTIILLIIENIGKGIALDVSFSSDRNIPEKAFGFENAKEPDTMSIGPLITGIPFFAPGDKRIITWGQYGGLKKGIGNNPINVTIRYKRKRPILWGYKSYENICPIDIQSFESTDASDSNYEKKSSEALDRIAKSFEYIKNEYSYKKLS